MAFEPQYRLLAGITRSRLLAVLRSASEPLGVRELAAAIGRHPNTVREQLDLLTEADLVLRSAAAPAGRGRPPHRYVADPRAADDPAAYRALAAVLVDELGGLRDARDLATAAGERWGHALAERRSSPADADPLEAIVELLGDVGFAPETPVETGAPIRLRRCPFATLARERGDVICAVHLGLIRGALDELDAPLDAVSLEPFVAPDLCLAHVAPRSVGATQT